MKNARNKLRRAKSDAGAGPTAYTPHYAYRGTPGEVYCEGAPLSRIAEAMGTPTYVYSRASIEGAYRGLDRAFGALPHTLCYAVKANPNLGVLRILARLGSSFDIVSGGELDRLRRLGVPGKRIVFSGVGKTREEIRDAMMYPGARGGILAFNVESGAELEMLLGEAARHVTGGGARASLAIRVNPDVLAGGHPHISTGHHHHKFGVDWSEARRMYLANKDSRWIEWRGITSHIGSQILSVAPYRRALKRLASYVRELGREGIRLEHVDIGGGFGVRYTNEEAQVPAAFARALAEIVRPLGCRLLVEPGRAIVGPAGVLLTRVLYVKENRGKTFVIVDAAMNDLIRPVLYGAKHAITRARRDKAGAGRTTVVDVVGPVCESADFLARDLRLAPVSAGDLLIVWTAGAYGFTQSSNYNGRRRAAEALVEGSRFRAVRRRETYDDLVRGETARA